jgi:hypothetical protein
MTWTATFFPRRFLRVALKNSDGFGKGDIRSKGEGVTAILFPWEG